MSEKSNNHNFYDSPTHEKEPDFIMTEAGLKARLDQGAFVMSREEAITQGFLTADEHVPTAIFETSVETEVE